MDLHALTEAANMNHSSIQVTDAPAPAFIVDEKRVNGFWQAYFNKSVIERCFSAI